MTDDRYHKLAAEDLPDVLHKFEESDVGCWEWRGHIGTYGYGLVTYHGVRYMAHRAVFACLVGAPDQDLDLDHLCRNRKCVRPSHLEPVTRRENLLRGETIPAGHALKTHCDSGHEFTKENTYLRPEGRYCRTCRTNAGIRRTGDPIRVNHQNQVRRERYKNDPIYRNKVLEMNSRGKERRMSAFAKPEPVK